MTVKSLCLASAFLLGLSPCVNAADAVVEEIVAVDDGFTWSGGYVGLQGGYLAGGIDITFPLFPTLFAGPDADGFAGGLYAGYNYQFSQRWLVGVEGEVNMMTSLEGDDFIYFNGQPITQETWETEVNWTAALRARIGYAFDRTLVYAAGGAAFIDYDAQKLLNNFPVDQFSETPVGWTIGGGVEHALTDWLVVRVDYRYSDFGSDFYPTETLNTTTDTDIELTTHEVKVGAALKF